MAEPTGIDLRQAQHLRYILIFFNHIIDEGIKVRFVRRKTLSGNNNF